MNDLPVPVLLIKNEENDMSDNDDYGKEAPNTESLNQYYKRKMTTNENRVSADADMPMTNARKDFDAEQRQSNWEHGSGPKLGKGESIWDNDPWKDKDQHGR